jgi:transcriptional regulator with GAF, ATPase, and Fis domain
VARAIHRFSDRGKRPFVAVNCAAIPRELLESELFGQVKGAFSGAFQPRTGKFREADGGTLFLDEIGDMPLEMQAKILRVLQDRVVTP